MTSTEPTFTDVHGTPSPNDPLLGSFLPRDKPSISVVVPILNDAQNLVHVLRHIPSWVDVVLVDDQSTGGTVDVALKLRPDIRIVTQEGRGKSAALRTGFTAATGDVIIVLDVDSATDPAQIPAFVGALLAGADLGKSSHL